MKKKVEALKEAGRVLKPGGKIIFGEFHRPTSIALRFSGRLFFRIFEKYAVEMWGSFDPARVLLDGTAGEWEFVRRTFFFGNYQVFSATRVEEGAAAAGGGGAES